MRTRSSAFDAKVKAVGVKPDGVEVKLSIEGLDGGLLHELAGMMALGTIDVTLAAKVEQHELRFTAGESTTKTLGDYPEDRDAGEADGIQANEAAEPPQGTQETAEGGAAATGNIWEENAAKYGEPGPNVGWILRCSVGDINYKTAVPRLTDEELRYCLERERRKTGLRQLRAEARRRGLKADERPAAGADTEDPSSEQPAQATAFF